MKKYLFLALMIIFPFILSGCGSVTSVPSNTIPTKTQDMNAQSSKNNTTETPAKTNEIASISIENFAFSPVSIKVKLGTTVTWTNNDSAPHQIKSDTFNSDRLGNGQSFSYTFNNIGTFNYICSIHPSMNGTIIVE